MSEEIKNTTPNTDDQVNENISNVDELSEDELDNVAGGYQTGGSGHISQQGTHGAGGGGGAGKVSIQGLACADGTV